MDNSQTPSTFLGSADGLVGSGIMGALVRAKDWSKTPLGPPAVWPQSLKTAISICLNCSFPILVWWGRDLIKIYNDAYRLILGNKHPDALGQKGELVWGEIWHVIGPMLHHVLEHGEASPANDMQLMLERRGYPEECYFSFSYSPIYDESGGVGGVFCPVMETTEQVIGARRLETLRRLAALPHAETVTDACVQACEVLSENGADVPFALLYLLSGDQARLVASAGIAPDGPYSPSQIDLAADGPWPLGRALAQPMVIANAGRTLPSGAWSLPPQESYLAPILLPGSDDAAGVMVVGINPHKKIDQSYRSFLDLLTGQMASRIADAVAYEAERKRAEALAELDRAKTAFFSNISHEFRTPLTLVLGPLEDMLREASGNSQEQLEVIHRNALRLLKLVNTLLDFVRIEAGRVKALVEPTDLAEFTQDLAGVFRSAVERAGLRLIVDCPALPQPVHVDRGMWEKIVLNLLSNALKFTFDGEIAVILKKRGHTVELSVSDTGTGIPADDLPRIFERFHRVEGAKGRTHEGSGIGLALVRELVRLHGGEVTVDSIEGRGTTFRVMLPIGTAAAGAPAKLAAPVGADVFVAEALRWLPNAGRDFDLPHPALMEIAHVAEMPSARVLVADDNADMRDYLKRLLSGSYSVATAADGQAALEMARENKPDLILSDVMMPRLDGFELLSQIRKDSQLRDTPVILLSARAGEEAKIEGLESGADDYLIKPFSARELLARVDSHLKLRRLRSENEERFSALVHASAQIVWCTAPGGEVEEDLPLWRAFTGQSDEEVRGWGWLNAVHPDDRAAVAEGGEHGIANGMAYEAEFRVRHRTGDWRWMSARCVPLKREDGSIRGWIGMNTDISDRKQAEQTQQLLINELNHRVKNTLASVQAIVHHTLRRTRDPDAFAASLTGRIQSLARMHTLLSSGSWKGAYLREIVRDQILTDPDDPTRVRIDGPLVRLEPQMALQIALMLHELATNSAKYGAFSSHTGQVGIEWAVEDRKLHFSWSERGGPPVSPPTRRGFGTMLIEQSAKSAGGNAEVHFAADGVRWTIDLPLSARAAQTAQGEVASRSRSEDPADGTGDQQAAAIVLAGKRFLVVEDEPLVILDLMGALEAVGAEVSSASTTERALGMITAGRFDGALLDANLLGRPVDEIAAALTRCRVPFVFITGYGRESLPSGYDSVTLLTKPVREDVLIAAAAKLVGRRS